jgi:uncharacterized membrane protein
MNSKAKLILMNCAVTAALLYRWWKGAPIVVLVITAVIMFTLVNVLMILSQKKFNSTNR